MTLIFWATNVLRKKLQKEAKRNLLTLSKTLKFFYSDSKLKLAYIKMESQVIVNQHVTVKMYLNFVHTARHILKVNYF